MVKARYILIVSLMTLGVCLADTSYATGLKFDSRDKTKITTKGDLETHDGTNRVRLPVGAVDGYVLSADSTTSTGLRWGIAGGGSGSGEVNTASNLGTGSQVFSDKNGTDLRFRTLVSGDRITMTVDASTITIGANVGSLGTQQSSNVTITGGSITGITDIAVADGGTGLSSGTSGGVLAYTASGTLASSAALTANAVVIGGGSGVVPSTITADTTAGHFLGSTTSSPAFRTVRNTDIAGTFTVSQGGTGATTLTDGAILLGDGTGAITNTGVLAKGVLIVGDGTTDPTLLSVGSNGQILSADSAQTSGVKWATIPSYDIGTVVAMTDGATITPNLDLGKVFTVTLGGNRTLGTPLNGIDGHTYIFIISQDATGSRTLGYSGFYRFGTDVQSPTLSTTAGRNDYLGMVYKKRGNKTSMDVVAVSLGYTD